MTTTDHRPWTAVDSFHLTTALSSARQDCSVNRFAQWQEVASMQLNQHSGPSPPPLYTHSTSTTGRLIVTHGDQFRAANPKQALATYHQNLAAHYTTLIHTAKSSPSTVSGHIYNIAFDINAHSTPLATSRISVIETNGQRVPFFASTITSAAAPRIIVSLRTLVRDRIVTSEALPTLMRIQRFHQARPITHAVVREAPEGVVRPHQPRYIVLMLGLRNDPRCEAVWKPIDGPSSV
jgi:hypothetical protein